MTNVENKAQMKAIFLYLEPLPLNTNITLSNNKTTAILLDKIKRPIARLLLLLLICEMRDIGLNKEISIIENSYWPTIL